jgi:hypothetical protein
MDHTRAIKRKYNEFLSRFPLQEYVAHHEAEEITTPILFMYGTSQSAQTASFDVKCLQWQVSGIKRMIEYFV